MKVGLRTDFTDFYDIYFTPHWDKADIYFERYATTPEKMMGRVEEFKLLDKYARHLGISVAARGLTTHFQNCRLVVYTDPLKHVGNGKELLSAKEAADKYPDCFASRYYPSDHSLRFLQIGTYAFKLKYKSNDWRSNCGDVEVEVLRTCNPIYCHYPILAIDYIEAEDGLDYAIDFNTAPGLSPLRNILTGEAIYDQIAKFYG